MRRCILAAWLCLALALLPPYLYSRRTDKPAAPADAAGPITVLITPSPSPAPEPSPSPAPEPTPEPSAEPDDTPVPSPTEAPAEELAAMSLFRRSGDEGISFLVRGSTGTFETTLAAYLPGVVAGEMPASFEEEALSAQAVAARTYILRKLQTPSDAHPDCPLCTDPACCCAWLDEAALRERWGTEYDTYAAKIAGAVRATGGAYLRYDNAPILACFHASSPGCTESAGAVWSEELPYLVSVRSPETVADVPGFLSSATWSAGEFKSRLEAAHPEAALGDDPAMWLGETVTDASGRVETMEIGAAVLRGTELRAIFSLRSAAFRVWWTGTDFLFTVEGCGHGVGMSQYGANTMALSGSSWREICTHYYPGAEITHIG